MGLVDGGFLKPLLVIVILKVEVILDEKPLTVKTSKVLETADEDPG